MPTNKRFTCPYCGKKYTRDNLVTHFEKVHDKDLPDGFTPLRMAFHVVNRKGIEYRRPCRICKLPTDWDENKGRYNFLCNKKSCHDAWVEQMKNTMGDKMGSNRPTATPEGLDKMLKSRKISGEYKFRDGGIKTYTGSYERKALEFMDKVLERKSEDIETPGPILEYTMDGSLHYYIPDIYYIPYNLIIEVKDGGNNPNGKTMIETRKRQMAKEKYIIEKTDYNYLRLTNNDFSQLLDVFADLKMHLVEDDSDRVIHVNEDATTIGAIPMNGVSDDGVTIVNYMKNNVFSEPDYAISKDFRLHNLIIRDHNSGKLVKADESFLFNTKYSVYSVKCDKDKLYESLLENMDKEVSDDFIYESVFGHKEFTFDQITFEESATPIKDIYQLMEENTKRIEKEIKGE